MPFPSQCPQGLPVRSATAPLVAGRSEEAEEETWIYTEPSNGKKMAVLEYVMHYNIEGKKWQL